MVDLGGGGGGGGGADINFLQSAIFKKQRPAYTRVDPVS